MQDILLIDDSKPIHPLVGALLADEPVKIHSAMDAPQGITLAASLRPELILLDVDMPGMNGFEACRQLKSNPATADIAVIFLTGLCSMEEKVRGLELGAVDYITKPFNRPEMLARVRASLRSSRLIRLLEEKARIDSLTGLGNRAMVDQRLAAEMSLHSRSHRPLSCILLDVDHFKQFNDNYGHPFGDQVLQKIASIIQDLCRTEDVACRYGGEEFIVITPHTTAAQALILAERMRVGIAKTTLNQQGAPVSVTCSFGVADALESYDRTMVQRADQALYKSKQQGRNRVSMVSSPAIALAAVA